MSKNQKNFRPRLEGLESREMLASNLAAALPLAAPSSHQMPAAIATARVMKRRSPSSCPTGSAFRSSR